MVIYMFAFYKKKEGTDRYKTKVLHVNFYGFTNTQLVVTVWRVESRELFHAIEFLFTFTCGHRSELTR